MSQTLIQFQNLHKAFGKKVVFDGLSLEVQRGETLTVIGGSGTGKSVLLKCLIGLLTPDSGHIRFDGLDVPQLAELELHEVRRRVGMVFQGAALFDSMSVGDNIAYPIRERMPELSDSEIASKVAEKLEWVNLPGIEAMKPADLSGGMRKRVGLARAIATEPEVILWDEPTTGLDPISTRIIDELIVSMQERLKVTSIVVTHDMDSAFRVSDRIAMIANRRVVACGDVDEMKASTQKDVRAFFDARLPWNHKHPA